MKSIVIYNSQTGFTKKYAEWISEESGAECVEFKKGKKLKLSEYDTIVFGSWFMAGGIDKLKWFKKQIPSLNAAGKKLIVYVTGATPAEAPDVDDKVKNNFTEKELSMVKTFYCPGGLDYDKMNGISRMAMNMLVKMLRSKKEPTEEEIAQAEFISKSFDGSDKKYIKDIVKEINS